MSVPSNLIPTRISQLPVATTPQLTDTTLIVQGGVTKRTSLGDMTAIVTVPPTRSIFTGTGLGGGGDLTQDRTIYLLNTGVTADTYGSSTRVPIITVNEQGQVINASTTAFTVDFADVLNKPTTLSGYGITDAQPLNANLTALAGVGTQGFYVQTAFGAATTRTLIGGTGITIDDGDGVIGNPVIALDDTGATPGIFGSATSTPVLTIDAQGRITTSGEILITPAWSSITDTPTTLAGYGITDAVPNTRTVTGTKSINGGGALSSNLTFELVNDQNAPGSLYYYGTDASGSKGWFALTSGGTVNSVGLSMPSIFTVSGSPVTSIGTLTATLNTQTANTVFAGPTSGGAATPAFRSLGLSDLPTITVAKGGTGLTSFTIGDLLYADGTTSLARLADVATGNALLSGGVGVAPSWGKVSLTTTVSGVLPVANGGTNAVTASGARTNLGAAASGANSDITSLVGITGAIAAPNYIDLSTSSTATLAAGRLWWDSTGTLNIGMGGGNITQQVGEELFVYGKASAAINDSPLQIVYQTGTVGGSGTITFGPTIAGITDGDKIIGVATESIALNGFGRVTSYGIVRGINTTGSAFGETWADGDTIWYNPVTGGPTNVKPVAPNLKVSVGVIIKAGSGGSGSIAVEINHGSVLGGTDSNVQITSVANNDLLQYNSSVGYWKNVAASSVSVGSATTATTAGSATTAGTATNLAGGSANQIPYQTGSGATSFITAPTVASTVLQWSGSAFQWVAGGGGGGSGTVTSVDVSGGTTGLTFSGGPVTTSGTITMSGTLDADNGGTGQTSYTVGDLLYASGTAALSKLSAGTVNYALVSNGAGSAPSYQQISLTAGVTGTLPIANGGTGQTTKTTAFDALSPTTTRGDLIVRGATNNVRLAIGTANYALVSNGADAAWSQISLTAGVTGTLPTTNGGTGTNTNFTTGSLVFAGSTGAYAQNNANLYWDNANLRLGIGTTSPGSALDVKGTLRLSGSSSGYVGLAPAAAAGSTTYTLPSADGTSGQALTTDGAGTLSWATTTSTPGGSTTQVQYNNAGAFAGSANMTFDGNALTLAYAGAALKLTGTGSRITGDFTNATVTNRVGFQTSTTNGNTNLMTLPNGTAVNSGYAAFNNADPTNAAYASLSIIGSTDVRLQSAITGTGTYLPLTIYTSGSEQIRLDTSGNLGIGTNAPGSKLDVKGTIRLSGSSSGYVGFAPAAAAGSTTYTLPTADGTSGQVLSTNGSGVLSWATASGGGTPGGSTTQVQYNNAGAFAGSANMTFDGTTFYTTTINVNTTGKTQKLYVSGNAAMNISALTDGATITPNFATANNFSVTLAGNRTLANPTGLEPGQSGVIFISQDATGSRTLAFGTYWDFPYSTAPVLTTTASAVDVLVYTVRSSTSIAVQLVPNIG